MLCSTFYIVVFVCVSAAFYGVINDNNTTTNDNNYYYKRSDFYGRTMETITWFS